jgi:rSAM/selenodomain-associated transferase 2
VRISVVIPALEEELTIVGTVRAVAAGMSAGDEIIVVDGGSRDRTCALVRSLAGEIPALRLIDDCERGRGRQQACGARESSGDMLWFLHADTMPCVGALEAIRNAPAAAGNFALRFSGSSGGARFLNAVYPWLRALRLYYGDSGIFVRRDAYNAAGGFRDFPIFEDLDLIHRLRMAGRFLHLDAAVTTSSRRFENRWFPGMFLHWTLLQVLYWLGAPPAWLGRWYKTVR